MSSQPLASPPRASFSSNSNSSHNYNNYHRPAAAASSSNKRQRSPPPDSRSSIERQFEARLFVVESVATAAATSANHSSSVSKSTQQQLSQSVSDQNQRLESLESHLQNLGLHTASQEARIKALEARVEQLHRQNAETLQQHARETEEYRTQLDHVKLTLTTIATNVVNCVEREGRIGHVMFVMSEHSRKIDEKLRACEHQRIKAEAFLRTLSHNAATLQGYNSLVDVGLHKIPELQQRASQNKKDLLIGMAPRMKTDHGIDVIDVNSGAYKTALFPRQPGQSPTANERAAALAAKAEADELLRMSYPQ